MIRVCVAGITGWTGRAVADAVEAQPGLELVSGVSRSDPAHFSSVAEALEASQRRARRLHPCRGCQAERSRRARASRRSRRGLEWDVGGGLRGDRRPGARERCRRRCGRQLLVTAALLLRFAAEAARHLEMWEVIDYASAGKQDAPSGTSRELAERLDAVRRRRSAFLSTTCTARARHGVRPSQARRFTRSDCLASRSRPRPSSRRTANGCRSATTPARARRPMSPERSSQSGPWRVGSGSHADSISCSAEMRRVLVTGMSGTGKSTALAELERRGFRIVDTTTRPGASGRRMTVATCGARISSPTSWRGRRPDALRLRHRLEPGPLLSALRRGGAPERAGRGAPAAHRDADDERLRQVA